MIIFLLITITFLFLSNIITGILVASYLKKKHAKEKELLLEKKKAWEEEQDKMHHTYSARTVAYFIILYSEKAGYEMSHLKLQKMLYFIQAYFVSCDFPPCFFHPIEAWSFGPVVPAVYACFPVPGLDILPSKEKRLAWEIKIHEISFVDKDIIRDVVDYFSDYFPSELTNIAISQDPWINAYKKGECSQITLDEMKKYFKGKK